MIEEQGTVVEVRAGRARLETERSASCGQCAARGACSHLGGGREARVWAEDPLGVRIGDRVVVAVPESTVVRASLVVYLMPVAFLLAGALLGNYLAPKWNISSDLGAAGLGLVAMVCAFSAARYLGGKAVVAGPKIVRKA